MKAGNQGHRKQAIHQQIIFVANFELMTRKTNVFWDCSHQNQSAACFQIHGHAAMQFYVI
jgi:hypothetical protein